MVHAVAHVLGTGFMAYSVAEIASFVEGKLHGEGSAIITSAQPHSCATPDSITFLSGSNRIKATDICNAGAIIVGIGCEHPANIPTIEVSSPLEAILKIAARFRPLTARPAAGIHPTAVVDPSARIGEGASIGPLAVVEADVEIGINTIIHAHAVVRAGCRIGQDVEIHPHAVLYPFTIVGDRTIIHAGVVLGCDGFGYIPNHPVHTKVPQLGHVDIREDVEIGANTTVDRATLGATTIGVSTKIDNQVMVGHNCQIGPRNILAAQVGLAGSCKTGDMVWMAGQVGVADHATICDGAMILGSTGVSRYVGPGERVAGVPHRPARDWILEQKALARLPKLIKEVNELRKKIEDGQDKERKCA